MSQIDAAFPIEGAPTTASVRQNFAYARDEIAELQARMGISVLDSAYGVVADGVTDVSAQLNAILVQAQVLQASKGHAWVYFGSGRYRCNDLLICSTSASTVAGTVGNVTLWGPGVLVQPDVANNTRLLNVNPNTGGSSDVANNAVNINIIGLTLEGTGAFREQNHLLNIHAVSNFLAEGVTFRNPRGDGAYVGSSNSAGVVRHNKNVRFRRCRFEGVNDNRNGVSLIDCDGGWVEDSYFYKIGKAGMPGPVDLEPNAATAILTNIEVSDCVADACIGDVCFGVNTAAAGMTTPIRGIAFRNNKMLANCAFGYGILVRTLEAINANTLPMFVDILENECQTPSCIPVGINRVKQCSVRGNKAYGTSAFEIGSPRITAGTFMDCEFTENMIQAGGYAAGQVTIASGSRLGIHRNHLIRPPAGVGSGFTFFGDGITTSSSDIMMSDNYLEAGPDQTHTVHVFGHTLNGPTNRSSNNTADIPLIDEFTAVRRPTINVSSAVAVTAPTDTSENILATLNVRGQSLGPNGYTRIRFTIGFGTGSADSKTIRVRFDGIAGTIFAELSTSDVGLLFLSAVVVIRNRGNVSLQFGGLENDPAFTQGTTLTQTTIKNTAAVVTSTLKTVVITAQKVTGANVITLESYEQETYYGA